MSWAEVQEGPAFALTIVGLIVVFGPLIAERLRLPGLLGLLIGGALIGPNMIGVLPSYATLESVGSIGVLYLIFLAGLQLDLDSFKRYRRVSAGFGLLTAFIPLVLGTITALALGIDAAAALLIGSFWASFTLITYPTVSRYGLTKNRAVAATVGASSITDTISMVLLALIIGAETGDSTGIGLVLSIALGLIALGLWCFVLVPKAVRAFFTGLGQARTLRYMAVFISLTSSAVVAELVGIEALIGAFFVGVGLNRLVPNASPLMVVTDFFGNAFFIPTFLISVGLLFDPEVMFVAETLRLALGFTVALVAGKAIAAWLTGRIFHLSGTEVGLMLSISVAQAAATLAATVIGLEAGLYGDEVVNAVMVVVAVSLVLTSIGTNYFAPKIPPPSRDRRSTGEAILLPAGGTDAGTLAAVVGLATRLTEPVGGVIQPIVVSTASDSASIDDARNEQTRVDEALNQTGQDVETALRIDPSIAAGLNRAAIQANSSMLLLVWPGGDRIRGRLLGTSYSEIVAATALPAAIAAIHPDANTAKGRVVLLARNRNLVPGHLPSLRIAADMADTLAGRDRPLLVGPLSPEALQTAGIDVPRDAEHRDGPDNIADWVAQNTQPDDFVVLPFRGAELRSAAIEIFDTGRSGLAVTHNPESRSALGGSTMTLPIGSPISQR